MRGTASLGASTSGPSRGKYAPLPDSILPHDPAPVAPLERSQALQTFFDCLTLIGLALFLCVTAVSVPVSIFLLLFASF